MMYHAIVNQRAAATLQTERTPVYDGLPLIGDHPAIDVVNTVEYRGRAEPGDRLSCFDALARWSTVAGLISGAELASITATARRSVGATRAYRSVIALREALYLILVAHVRAMRPSRDAVHTVEHALQTIRAAAELTYDPAKRTFSWR